jgi:hypothetical protein
MIEAGFITPLPKLVTKASIREGATEFVDKECQIANRRRVDDRLQGWKDRQHQLVRLVIATLVLSEYQFAAAHMLSPKPNGI